MLCPSLSCISSSKDRTSGLNCSCRDLQTSPLPAPGQKPHPGPAEWVSCNRPQGLLTDAVEREAHRAPLQAFRVWLYNPLRLRGAGVCCHRSAQRFRREGPNRLQMLASQGCGQPRRWEGSLHRPGHPHKLPLAWESSKCGTAGKKQCIDDSNSFCWGRGDEEPSW